MDKLKIDSHKLIYHPQRVSQWLDGKNIFPLYAEIAPSGGCNHRCIFCGLDYIGYKPKFLKTKCIKNFLAQAAKSGLKSLMYAGEGEPLLHKDIADLVNFAKNNKIDVSITTNGVYLNKNFILKSLKSISWIRISCNAGSKKTYAKIHQTNPNDFTKVINNIRLAVKIKKKNKLKTTIGVQTLLLKENFKEILILAKTLKKIGADYLTIKPYSKHPLSKNSLNTLISPASISNLKKQLDKIATAKFDIILRTNTIKRLENQKQYSKCYGIPFWTYIDSNGDVYACSSFLGNKKFSFGNICKQGFKNIWQGSLRKKVMQTINSRLNIKHCRKACRLDAINQYLWELKNPPEHVNFI